MPPEFGRFFQRLLPRRNETPNIIGDPGENSLPTAAIRAVLLGLPGDALIWELRLAEYRDEEKAELLVRDFPEWTSFKKGLSTQQKMVLGHFLNRAQRFIESRKKDAGHEDPRATLDDARNTDWLRIDLGVKTNEFLQSVFPNQIS